MAARKPTGARNETIRCENCGEYYAVTYKRCPFCEEQEAVSYTHLDVYKRQGMDPAVVTEMNAVGGTIIVGIALNMLGLPKEKIRVGNMLPAIFLPIGYIPLANFLSTVVG